MCSMLITPVDRSVICSAEIDFLDKFKSPDASKFRSMDCGQIKFVKTLPKVVSSLGEFNFFAENYEANGCSRIFYVTQSCSMLLTIVSFKY